MIQEAYIHGVSTRSVDDLVQAMGASGISKSQVSRLCAEIDERVNAFLDRPIEGEWPYLWLDATYVKVRQDGRIVSLAATIATAVNTDGRREVLGGTGQGSGRAAAGMPVEGWPLAPARPRPSGPSSCTALLGEASVASNWSSPTRTKD